MPEAAFGRALVVGGDGLIGSMVVQTLRARAVEVIATTRRRERVSASCVFLDLLDATALRALPPADVVFLCAAETSSARCEADPAGTRAVNVERIGLVADQCHAAGAFLILPSSAAVFDGQRPRRRPDDPLSPATEYGRQKADIEAHVLGLRRSAAVRLAKVFGMWPRLLAGWRASLVANRPVQAFSDMVLAPVTDALAAEALIRVAAARSEGVFQLSADRDVTYLSVAQRLAAHLTAPPGLVLASTTEAACIPAAAVPRHTTLDVTRLSREIGIDAPDAWQVIDAVTPRDLLC